MMRPLELTDCDGVADLIRRAFATPEAPLQPPPSALAVTGTDVSAHLRAGGGGVMEPGRSCLLWAERDGALHLSRLAVLPKHRRQGLAQAMLAQAEREARARGLPRLTLSTRLVLTGNRRLFARFGFVEGALSSHPGYPNPTMVDFAKLLQGVPCMVGEI